MKGSFTGAWDFKLPWWIYNTFSIYTHLLGNAFGVWNGDVIIRFLTERPWDKLQFGVSPRPPACSSLIFWEDSWNSEKPLCSWLRFTTVKGYRLKSVKGRSAWGRVQGRPGGNFQVSPPGGAGGQCLFLGERGVHGALPSRNVQPRFV